MVRSPSTSQRPKFEMLPHTPPLRPFPHLPPQVMRRDSGSSQDGSIRSGYGGSHDGHHGPRTKSAGSLRANIHTYIHTHTYTQVLSAVVCLKKSSAVVCVSVGVCVF